MYAFHSLTSQFCQVMFQRYQSMIVLHLEVDIQILIRTVLRLGRLLEYKLILYHYVQDQGDEYKGLLMLYILKDHLPLDLRDPYVRMQSYLLIK